MNTHDSFVRFGKYNGERVTRIPVGYLKWAVANRCEGVVELANGAVAQLHEVAPFEIQRRGERLENIEISMHAIDRASLYFIPQFRLNHGHMEGLASWLGRLAWEAWQQRESIGKRGEDGIWKIEYSGIKFIIEELAVPVVKTVES